MKRPIVTAKSVKHLEERVRLLETIIMDLHPLLKQIQPEDTQTKLAVINALTRISTIEKE